MTSAPRFFVSMALAMILPGCSGPVSPSLSSTVQINSPLGSLRSESATSSLPVWITEPVVLPDGRVGKNNCTFALPAEYQWNAHPEGGCWEHPGPDGWARQQFQKVHIPSFLLPAVAVQETPLQSGCAAQVAAGSLRPA